MAGKKYGLEDKYKMMYGGMTNPPVRASLGLFIKAGVAGAKKIAQSLAKSKDINVGRDVSKYDTSTLTDKGAFVKRRKELGLGMKVLPDTSSEFVKRRKELGLGMKVLPDTSSEFVKRRLQLRAGPLKAADVGKKSVVKEAVKKTLKNPVVKYGSAATAGYEAKEIVDDMKKPKGKRNGGAAIKGKGAVTGGSGLQDEKLKPGAMYKANTGKLIGNQRKLDINKDGKISGEDFKLLKSKKKR
jgi:hypothetical protein